MGLIVTNKGSDFELVPEDTHHAVCYAVYDIGTHPNEMFGGERHQLVISWELPQCQMEDGRPMAISKFYTASLNEKAALRKDLKAWRGRDFTDEELEGFNVSKLLSANCILQVMHKKSGEKVRPVVNAVMPMLKGMEILTPKNKTMLFEINEDGTVPEFPEGMPDWIRDMIKKSNEYRNGGDVPPEAPPYEDSDIEPF